MSEQHTPATGTRKIVYRTRGTGRAPITRLMSPSDLGQIIKPFVFLDIFEADKRTIAAMEGMPLHPHSGIATVTVPIEGEFRFDDPASGAAGVIAYGGVEWSRAGGGMWHGKEMSVAGQSNIQGFQLWLALPPELENGPAESLYIEAQHIPQAGPARVLVGRYGDAQSPVPAPDGINYLLVRIPAGERWTYRPPAGHSVGWLALAQGRLSADSPISGGEMVVFEPGEAAIELAAAGDEDAVFVLGSAIPHPWPLHLGSYSVHTSARALEAGEQRIAELGQKLREAGERRTPGGTIPVFR